MEQVRNHATEPWQNSFHWLSVILSNAIVCFPKTFGLNELKKGYFPQHFNRPENQNYEGPIPDQHYYMPEVMPASGCKAFETWHAQQTGTFNFAEELVTYCKSDVKLLKEGCLKFKQLFEEKAKFNPFSCMTIASACNHDLRQNQMKANTIASEPLEWLHWEDSKLHRIQHARNEGEFRIPKLLTQFTNFKDVFITDVANAIQTEVKVTVVSKTEAWKMCTLTQHEKSLI